MQLGCHNFTSVIDIVHVYNFIHVCDLKERHCRDEVSKERESGSISVLIHN
jgi:hypothetical protein